MIADSVGKHNIFVISNGFYFYPTCRCKTRNEVNEVLTSPDGDDHKDLKDMVICFINESECDGMQISFIPEMYMNAPMYDCN